MTSQQSPLNREFEERTIDDLKYASIQESAQSNKKENKIFNVDQLDMSKIEENQNIFESNHTSNGIRKVVIPKVSDKESIGSNKFLIPPKMNGTYSKVQPLIRESHDKMQQFFLEVHEIKDAQKQDQIKIGEINIDSNMKSMKHQLKNLIIPLEIDENLDENMDKQSSDSIDFLQDFYDRDHPMAQSNINSNNDNINSVNSNIRKSMRFKSSFKKSFINEELYLENDETISYMKLQKSIQQNHPMNEQGERFSIFESIGFLRCPCIQKNKEILNFSQQLGLGASLFLMTTKALAILFLVLSILNIPVMFIYFNGNDAQIYNLQQQTLNVDLILQMLTLGNLGQSDSTCSIQNQQIDKSLLIQCKFGQLSNLVAYGIAFNDSSKCSDDATSLQYVQGCTFDSTLFENTYLQDFQDSYTKNCYGKVKCSVNFNLTILSESCLQVINDRNQISKYNTTYQIQIKQEQQQAAQLAKCCLLQLQQNQSLNATANQTNSTSQNEVPSNRLLEDNSLLISTNTTNLTQACDCSNFTNASSIQNALQQPIQPLSPLLQSSQSFPLSQQPSQNSTTKLPEPRIIMFSQCSQENLNFPSVQLEISKSAVGLIVVVEDIITITIIIIFTIIMEILLVDYSDHYNKKMIQMQDFTLQVQNLPFDKEFDENDEILKANLWQYFQKLIQNQIEKQSNILENIHDKNFQIVDITFAKQEIKDTDELINLFDTYKKYQDYAVRRTLLNKNQDNKIFEKNLQMTQEKYDKSILKFLKFQKQEQKAQDFIQKSMVVLQKDMNLQQEQQQSIKAAFIIFRSIKGKKYALNESKFENNYLLRKLQSCIFKKKIEEDQKKKFYNRWLNVTQSTQPDMIKWENIGHTSKKRLFQRIFIWLIVLIVIFLDIVIISNLKYQNDQLQAQFNTKTKCPQNVTQSQAYNDYVDNNSQLSLMSCFCSSQFYINPTGFQNIQFTNININDYNLYCLEWAKVKIQQTAIIVSMSLIIVIINILICFLFQNISAYEIHLSENDQTYSQFQKITITQFINLAIIILIVNFNAYQTSKNFQQSGNSISNILLNGNYHDFSIDWYQNVGTSICITLLMNIFSPYGMSLLRVIIITSQRWADRGFTTNVKKFKLDKSDKVNTKLQLQSELQALYTGSQIQSHYVYAQLFTNFGACMLYSCGLPILYPIAFLFYVIIYWVYKILLVKFYQKTTKNNEELAISSIGYIRYGVIMHMITGAFMFSNPSVIQQDTLKEIQGVFYQTQELDNIFKRRFRSFSIQIYLAFCLTVIIIYALSSLGVMQIKQKCIRLINYFNLNSEINEDEKSEDILKEFSISQLTEFYKRCSREHNEFKNITKGNYDKNLFSKEQGEEQLKRLKGRINSIENVVNDHIDCLISMFKVENKDLKMIAKINKYSCLQKLYLLMANENIFKQDQKDRLRMIGLTQSYHIHDSAQYQKAKSMTKIIAKEDYKNYLEQKIYESNKKQADDED